MVNELETNTDFYTFTLSDIIEEYIISYREHFHKQTLISQENI